MLLFFMAPIPLGFLIGFILFRAERSDAVLDYASAEIERAAVSDARKGDLRDVVDTIIDIYSRHGFKLISRSEHQLVFHYPVFFDRIMGRVIWYFFLSFGGVLGLLVAFYFFGVKGENVEVDLYPHD